MRRLVKITFNGLCLMLLCICLAVCLLGWQSRHAITYVIGATLSGRWGIAQFSGGTFVLLTWRAEPAAVWPRWYSVTDPATSGGEPLMDGRDSWHVLGFCGRSGLPGSNVVGVRAGRHVDESDPSLKRHDYTGQERGSLDPDFDGPWPGWGAISGDELTNGAWFCLTPMTGSCLELEGSISSAAAVSAALPLLWLILWLSRICVRQRCRRVGLCHVCKYDLTLNQSGRCPECGTKVSTLKAGHLGLSLTRCVSKGRPTAQDSAEEPPRQGS